MAKYEPEINSVFIQAALLRDGTADDLMLTLIHELRHCWQSEMSGLYHQLDKNDYAQLYPMNIVGIIDVESTQRKLNFNDYYFSIAEVDARDYSEYRLSKYSFEEEQTHEDI